MTMEAKVAKGALWKRLIDAVKDLVNEANFECSPHGISIQSMDSAHVALVSLGLHFGTLGEDQYNCSRQTILGVNLGSLAKILKVTDNDDMIILRHQEDSDTLTVTAESANGKKSSEFQLKLMEIEADAIGIPEMEYRARLSLPSEQFARIIRDMTIFGETITVDVETDKVKFSGAGDIGEGYVTLNSDGAVSEKSKVTVKGEVKKELKSEPLDDEVPLTERYKEEAAAAGGKKKKGSGAEKSDGVYISTEEPIQLSFALRYLTTFSKGSTLSDRVEIYLAKECPCRIEYQIENLGYLRWYLAPKVDGDE